MVTDSMPPEMGACNPYTHFCADRSAILASLTAWLATRPDDVVALDELNSTLSALRQVHGLMTGRISLREIAA